MNTSQAPKVLAPYGSTRYVPLATKVGSVKSVGSDAPQRRVVRLKQAA